VINLAGVAPIHLSWPYHTLTSIQCEVMLPTDMSPPHASRVGSSVLFLTKKAT
jgi:hypothetical protein